jgi:hypothetical protein
MFDGGGSRESRAPSHDVQSKHFEAKQAQLTRPLLSFLFFLCLEQNLKHPTFLAHRDRSTSLGAGKINVYDLLQVTRSCRSSINMARFFELLLSPSQPVLKSEGYPQSHYGPLSAHTPHGVLSLRGRSEVRQRYIRTHEAESLRNAEPKLKMVELEPPTTIRRACGPALWLREQPTYPYHQAYASSAPIFPTPFNFGRPIHHVRQYK